MIADDEVTQAARFLFRKSGKVLALPAKGILKLLKKGVVTTARKTKEAVSEKINTGKVHSIKRLEKHYGEWVSITANTTELNKFDKYAKKYHLTYNLQQHESDKTLYSIIVPQKDIEKFRAVLEDFCANKTLDNDSLQDRINDVQERGQTFHTKKKEHTEPAQEQAKKTKEQSEKGKQHPKEKKQTKSTKTHDIER